MKPFISTTTYGFINYIGALTLLSSPYTFDLIHVGGAALFIPILMGAFLLYIAIFSDNKVGFIKIFPMQMSLFLAMFAGFALIAGPFFYGFAFDKGVYLPHVVIGAMLSLCALFTQNSPFTTKPHEQLPEAGITSTDALEGRLNV